ncbi:MAG: AAA family ATPase [Deltaproteobacteria bacterium]|nr:AAA family ATPase [Deltaproteobacteria bacterium]
MYYSFFSLRENPFNLTPDPRFLYLSTYHKEALESLISGINERRGLITITGDIGTGKTTLCRTLLSQLDDTVKTALIFNSFISDMELLESLNQEFGIETGEEPDTIETRTLLLKKFLLQNVSQRGNAVLVIDEAQNLSYSVLRQILNLSELQVGEEKLLQIVLMGQPELRDNLASPLLENFDKSIALRYELKSLEPKDIQGYIEHRLEVAGGKSNVIFSDGVFERVYEYSLGNPRRINAICDRALLIAYVEGEHIITVGMIGKSVEELRGDISLLPIRERSLRGLKRIFLFFLLPLAVVIFSGWTIKDHVIRIFSNGQKSTSFRIIKPMNPLIKETSRNESRISASPKRIQVQEQYAKPGSSRPKPLLENPNSEAETTPAGEIEEETGIPHALNEPSFSVQVGAFQVEANARNLLAELAQKGYDPVIVSMLDYRDNLWHTVRIRENAAPEDAYQAASDYRDREGKPAIVTKTGSLDPVSP